MRIFKESKLNVTVVIVPEMKLLNFTEKTYNVFKTVIQGNNVGTCYGNVSAVTSAKFSSLCLL